MLFRNIFGYSNSKWCLGRDVGLRFARSIHVSEVRWSEEEKCRYSEDELRGLVQCRKEGRLEECLLEAGCLDPRLETPKVVIVGAGMAGLSAADWLLHSGITDVTLLEATDRPGGRIHSCWLDGAVVELGASRIEGGSPANPVFNLACREGLVTEPGEEGRWAAAPVLASGRAEDLRPHVGETAYHSFELIKEQAAELYARTETDFGSLESFIEERARQELKVFPEEWRRDAAAAFVALANGLRTEVGAELGEVSASAYGSLTELPGGGVKLPSGMIGSVAPLLRDLPACALHYRKPVATVEWEGPPNARRPEPRLRVVCCDDTVFAADYVIVTVSLGYLKRHADRLFSPGLPDDKREAIERLGYGHAAHAYFKYEERFWARGEGTAMLGWAADEAAERRLDWARSVAAWEEDVGQEGLLGLRVAGRPETECLEGMTESRLREEMGRLTRAFTGDPLLPLPSRALCSGWSGHPYFLGARAYLCRGSCVGHQCALASPLPPECGPYVPALLFAGEATWPGLRGTLHGARLSGLREARRLVALTERLRGPPRSSRPHLMCATSSAP